jgi:hypothetical protein
MRELAEQYPDYDLAMFPLKRVLPDFNDPYLPEDVLDAGQRLIAKQNMQRCPSAPPTATCPAPNTRSRSRSIRRIRTQRLSD